MAVNWLGLLSIGVFYIMILGMGIWASRKSKREEKKCTGKSSEVAMVGGRNLNIWVSICTMTATWVGGGYILGTAEMVYNPTKGLVWATAPLSFAMDLIVGALFFVKPIRSKNYVTLMDPFQEKYGNTVAAVIFIPSLIGNILWIACILGLLGGTISVVMDISYSLAVCISAAVAILYTLMGGLYSVAYTDVIQLGLVFVGLWLCVPFILANPSSANITVAAVTKLNQEPWIGRLEPEEAGRWVDEILLMVIGGICYQAFYQRVLSTATDKQAKITLYAAAALCPIFAIPSLVIGAVAASTREKPISLLFHEAMSVMKEYNSRRHFDTKHGAKYAKSSLQEKHNLSKVYLRAHKDWNETSFGSPSPYEQGKAGMILPIALQHLCPFYVSLFGMGALAAAVMSSVDSALLSAASLLGRNIFKNLIYKRASEKTIIAVVKGSVLLCGIIGASLAMTAQSIHLFWIFGADVNYSMMAPQVIYIFYLSRSVNHYGACAGFVLALVLRALVGEPLMGLPDILPLPWDKMVDGHRYRLFPFRTAIMLITMATILAVSFFARWLSEKGLLTRKSDTETDTHMTYTAPGQKDVEEKETERTASLILST